MRRRRTTKVSEIVASEILDYILEADLEPGTRLPPESVMLQSYDVGRGSLREALRILEVYGLVAIRPGPGGGPEVQAVGPQELGRLLLFHLNVHGVTFEEMSSSSRLLQATMLADAARRRDPEVMAAMRAALDGAHAAAELPAYVDAIHAFHEAAFRAPGGRFLGLVYDALQLIMRQQLRGGIPLEDLQGLLSEQEQVLQAIVDGDEAAALRRAYDHAEHVHQLTSRTFPGLSQQVLHWT